MLSHVAYQILAKRESMLSLLYLLRDQKRCRQAILSLRHLQRQRPFLPWKTQALLPALSQPIVRPFAPGTGQPGSCQEQMLGREACQAEQPCRIISPLSQAFSISIGKNTALIDFDRQTKYCEAYGPFL